MRKLIVFNQVTLDGYFSGPNGDISWAHLHEADDEWKKFQGENAKGGGHLVFGRITYEMMASYWPTPQAAKDNPEVAEGMNRLPKTVFSRTLGAVSWENTTVVKTDAVAEMRKMKHAPGKDMVIMGSGTLVSQLTQAELIDEYQIVVYPIVLGEGRSLFEGIKKKLTLKRARTRTFGNGNVVLWYERAA